jgi:hypothetical protein
MGLVPDELRANGARLNIEPPTDDRLEDEGGLLVIPAAGTPVSDGLAQKMRDADQR